MESEVLEILDKLPKSIWFKNGDVYSLTIHKNEWEGHSNAWIITYSKENKKSLSTINTIIKVESYTFSKALNEIKTAVDNLIVSLYN